MDVGYAKEGVFELTAPELKKMQQMLEARFRIHYNR
jgi:hypothetical protein